MVLNWSCVFPFVAENYAFSPCLGLHALIGSQFRLSDPIRVICHASFKLGFSKKDYLWKTCDRTSLSLFISTLVNEDY